MGSVMLHMLAIALSVASAFPISSIQISEAHLATLNSTTASSAMKNALGNQLVAAELRKWASTVANMVVVAPGDIKITGTFPYKTIDDSCSHKITASDTAYTWVIDSDSYLNGSLKVNLAKHSAAIWGEAYLDESITVGTTVHVRLGTKVFGKCISAGIGHQGLSTKSTGKNLIGAELAATHMHIALVNSTWSLVFNLGFTLKAQLLSWNIDEVTASGMCKLKVLGIQVYNVCGWIANQLKDTLQPFLTEITTVTAPKLLQKIQDKVNAATGDTVVIPLKKLEADA